MARQTKRPSKASKRASDQPDLWSSPKPNSSDRPKGSTKPKTADSESSLTKELAKAKAEIRQLKQKLEQCKRPTAAQTSPPFEFLSKLVPALVVHQHLKNLALKETRKAIRPLKPSTGMIISTTARPAAIGKAIGYPVRVVRNVLEQLSNVNAIVNKNLGAIEVGRFEIDTKGKIVPIWNLDFGNPDDLVRLVELLKQKTK